MDIFFLCSRTHKNKYRQMYICTLRLTHDYLNCNRREKNVLFHTHWIAGSLFLSFPLYHFASNDQWIAFSWLSCFQFQQIPLTKRNVTNDLQFALAVQFSVIVVCVLLQNRLNESMYNSNDVFIYLLLRKPNYWGEKNNTHRVKFRFRHSLRDCQVSKTF